MKKTNPAELEQKLKKTLLAIVVLPVFIITSFVFFGPTIGRLFGLFSENRNAQPNTHILLPETPIFKDIPSATNRDRVDINGYATSGTTIKLFVNGPEVANTLTTGDGVFEFKDIQLSDGKNTLFAKAYDDQNVESEKSETLTLLVDKKAPELELTSPKDKETVRNLNERVNIIGKVNEKATIKINDRLAILKPDMTFDFLLGVKEGTIEIKIQATDEAGNTKEETITIKYEKKSS